MSLVVLCNLYLPKSSNFINAFICYKQKYKLTPNLAHRVDGDMWKCSALGLLTTISSVLLNAHISATICLTPPNLVKIYFSYHCLKFVLDLL